MRYKIEHITRYEYAKPATLGHNLVHLAPRTFERQRCLDSRLTVNPAPTIQTFRTDYFGNGVAYFTLEEPHTSLEIKASSEVAVEAGCDRSLVGDAPWETARDAVIELSDEGAADAAPFTFDSPHVSRSDEALEYATPSFPPGRPLIDAALELTQRIHADFAYTPAVTAVNTPTSEIFRLRRGVCQDFAHLQITCLRSLGLAARYVSGYLVTRPPPGKPRLVGADQSHAWLAVYFPGAGWLDFDPTNKQIVGIEHITLAWGRDYSDVCPIKGVFLGGGAHSVRVSVDVAPQPPA